jgi:3-methyladenine DNA glycosylase AlkD
MDYNTVMKELKNMGTEQNRKIYKRHGAGDNLFGVSFANLNKLKKAIKVDHKLAQELWETGNSDARTLALMIADPKLLTPTVANTWLKDISYYLLADMLSALVARASFARTKMEQWMKDKKEFARQCGYDILAVGLKNGLDISDDDCKKYLKKIESEIHSSPNRARHAMNNAVMAIGIFRPSLTRTAIATAKRIGKVEVDHGETSCKTPDAVGYIEKAVARKK